jgi:hypothetical protein
LVVGKTKKIKIKFWVLGIGIAVGFCCSQEKEERRKKKLK